MEELHVVQVSPLHSVTIDDDYQRLITLAPSQDYVVRTLARKMAGDQPMMIGELVIAGYATREHFPLAKAYPLHFRKTYYAGQLRGDPQVEFERHTRASEILGIAPPIGHTYDTFRSCLLPGKPLNQLSHFGTEPQESNLKHAEDLALPAAAGLWMLAERVYDIHTRLHAAGLAHGDAYLHNFIVCSSPLDVVPIDFDMAMLQQELGEEAWQKRCEADLDHVLELAIYLQCALGKQSGPLAELALSRMDKLVSRPQPFLRAIESGSALTTHL